MKERNKGMTPKKKRKPFHRYNQIFSKVYLKKRPTKSGNKMIGTNKRPGNKLLH